MRCFGDTWYSFWQVRCSSCHPTISVQCTIHLERLSLSFGLSDYAPEWFRSYITGWTQSVRIGASQSSTIVVRFGVPQGSVLGPLILSLALSNMPASSLRRASSTYVGLEQSAAHWLTLSAALLTLVHADLTIATRLCSAAKCLSFVAYSRYRTPQLGWYWTFTSLGVYYLQPCHCVCLVHRWDVQKRLNRSRCRLGDSLKWIQRTMY